ncbi:MAG: hypothetical protein R3B47_15490 [Bacteroidia bacterium]
MDKDMHVEILDLTFEEGAFIIHDEYKTTIGLLRLHFSIPKFTISEKRACLTVLPLSEHRDIDYILYPHFPREFLVKVEDIAEWTSF